MASSSRIFKNAAYSHLAEIGKALSSPVRLELLELLVQSPRTVDVLAKAIEKSVAATSHHLQALKRAQLVKTTRQGVHITYAIAGEDIAQLLVQLQGVAERHIAGLERLRRDYFKDRDALEAIDSQTLLERLSQDDIVLVDVRPDYEYTHEHIPGALSIPLSELEARLAELPKDRPIVAYCRGPYCTFSADAARRLRDLGYDAHRSDISVQSLKGMGALS